MSAVSTAPTADPVDAVEPDLDLTAYMTDGPPKPKARHDGRPDVVWNDEYKWV